jgi:hypothetical protein
MDRRPSRQTEAPETQTTADLKSDSTLTQPDPFDLFDIGLQLGLAYGRRAGIVEGRAEEGDARDEVWGLVTERLRRSPAWAELQKRRAPSDAPCSTRCRRCARCVRALTVAARLRVGLPADHPGDAT